MNRIIDSQQRHRSLESRLQAANLAHRRLEHTRAQVVPDLAVEKVKPIAHQLALRVSRRRVLPCVMVRTQFGGELCRVFGRVHSKSFGDDKKRSCEFRNSELFTRALML